MSGPAVNIEDRRIFLVSSEAGGPDYQRIHRHPVVGLYAEKIDWLEGGFPGVLRRFVQRKRLRESCAGIGSVGLTSLSTRSIYSAHPRFDRGGEIIDISRGIGREGRLVRAAIAGDSFFSGAIEASDIKMALEGTLFRRGVVELAVGLAHRIERGGLPLAVGQLPHQLAVEAIQIEMAVAGAFARPDELRR